MLYFVILLLYLPLCAILFCNAFNCINRQYEIKKEGSASSGKQCSEKLSSLAERGQGTALETRGTEAV